jgi:hypothetical protein
MSAQPRQRDLIRECPAALAKAYRQAAEASRAQFPLDDSRARWYERKADEYEQMTKEMK